MKLLQAGLVSSRRVIPRSRLYLLPHGCQTCQRLVVAHWRLSRRGASTRGRTGAARNTNLNTGPCLHGLIELLQLHHVKANRLFIGSTAGAWPLLLPLPLPRIAQRCRRRWWQIEVHRPGNRYAAGLASCCRCCQIRRRWRIACLRLNDAVLSVTRQFFGERRRVTGPDFLLFGWPVLVFRPVHCHQNHDKQKHTNQGAHDVDRHIVHPANPTGRSAGRGIGQHVIF